MDYSKDYNNLSSKELDEEPELVVTHCDFCQTKITADEEERHITAGDEGLTLCESCGSHYLD
jgi:aminoglycoside phosphotransferase